MLISRGTAPEQPVEWARSLKISRRICTNFYEFKKFLYFRILTNFKTESHEFSSYVREHSVTTRPVNPTWVDSTQRFYALS